MAQHNTMTKKTEPGTMLVRISKTNEITNLSVRSEKDEGYLVLQ